MLPYDRKRRSWMSNPAAMSMRPNESLLFLMRARVKPVNPHPSCFQNKLWKMVESNQFMSIWWSEGGKCIAVNEDLFKQKCWAGQDLCVLLLTESMRSFIRQVNLYGFVKLQQDFQRSASLPEFLPEAAAASAQSKVHQLFCTSTNCWSHKLLYCYNCMVGRGDGWKASLPKPRWSTCRGHVGVSTHDGRPPKSMGESTSQPRQCLCSCSRASTSTFNCFALEGGGGGGGVVTSSASRKSISAKRKKATNG